MKTVLYEVTFLYLQKMLMHITVKVFVIAWCSKELHGAPWCTSAPTYDKTLNTNTHRIVLYEVTFLHLQTISKQAASKLDALIFYSQLFHRSPTGPRRM